MLISEAYSNNLFIYVLISISLFDLKSLIKDIFISLYNPLLYFPSASEEIIFEYFSLNLKKSLQRILKF